jgi:hypothetical protein
MRGLLWIVTNVQTRAGRLGCLEAVTRRGKIGEQMSVDGNKSVIREFTRVFKNEHNVDGINHLFADDFKHNFRAPLPPGLAGLKNVGRMMNGAFRTSW